MWFRLPFPPLAFEIDDDWLIEAAVEGFHPETDCFRYILPGPLEHVAVLGPEEVAPMLRKPGVHPASHGFRRYGFNGEKAGGMVGVLTAVVTGWPLPPIQVCRTRAKSAEGFSYKIQDGFHRFYASHALGFTHLPCVIQHDLREQLLFGDE